MTIYTSHLFATEDSRRLLKLFVRGQMDDGSD